MQVILVAYTFFSNFFRNSLEYFGKKLVILRDLNLWYYVLMKWNEKSFIQQTFIFTKHLPKNTVQGRGWDSPLKSKHCWCRPYLYILYFIDFVIKTYFENCFTNVSELSVISSYYCPILLNLQAWFWTETAKHFANHPNFQNWESMIFHISRYKLAEMWSRTKHLPPLYL